MGFLFYFKDLFWALILRPVLRDPFRMIITILGVAIGVAVFLSIQLANRQTLRSFEESVDLVLGRADAIVHAEGMAFDEKYFQELSHVRKLVKFYPVIEGYGVELKTGQVVEILGTDLLQDSGIRDFSIKTLEKDLKGLLPLIMDPKGIVLPEKFIPGTNFKPGDKINFLINGIEKTFNVNAILENKGLARALNGNFALMDIAAAQWAFGRIGKLDRIDIEFKRKENFASIREKLSEVLPDFLRVDRPERKNRQVEKMLRAFQYNLTALSFVALIVALYLIYNMVALSVVRRRAEIGTLRAIGATPLLVASIFFVEAGIIGAAGSVIGIWLGKYLAQFSLDAVSVTVNNLYTPSYVTEVDFNWLQSWPYLLLGVGLSLVSALIPAIDASRTSPTTVMRRGSYDLKIFRGDRRLTLLAITSFAMAGIFSLLPPIGGFPYFGFLAVFFVIMGVSFLSPSALLAGRDLLRGICKKYFGGEGFLACMNLSQNIGRNSLAISSLAIAFMMIISMSIMVHSFRQTVIVWVGQTLKADLFVRVAGGRDIDYQYTLPGDRVEDIRKISGVAAVDLFRAQDISYNDKLAVLGSGDFEALSRYGNLVIKSGPTAQELFAQMVGQDRAIISESFALKHEVGVGDSLFMETPNGSAKLQVVAVYYDYSRERGYIIIDRSIFIKYYGDTDVNSFVIYLSNKNEIENVRQELLKTLGADYNLVIRSNPELKKNVLEIFDKTFAITYSLEIIAGGVALLGLFNTLIALILERKREIGIIRFIGGFQEQVRRMVLIESGILGLIGSIMGVAAGGIVSYILIFVINKQSFGWTIQIHFPYIFVLFSLILFW
ncbi:MAG: ABC transporter permease, partial [Nitrospina sp.]|nr:ABC transporter permease [Nitrospina sp.]